MTLQRARKGRPQLPNPRTKHGCQPSFGGKRVGGCHKAEKGWRVGAGGCIRTEDGAGPQMVKLHCLH